MSHCPQPKRCARRGCDRLLVGRAPHALYCSLACGRSAFQTRAIARARAAGADPMRLIKALREETPAGHCIYCEVRLPATRRKPRFKCDSPECLRLYNRDYQNARRNPPEVLRGDA
jgi:hypothetical protein